VLPGTVLLLSNRWSIRRFGSFMSSYSEKLKDPRWQKKRLVILERDNFACRMCKNSKETLHVHHLEYRKQPWDVPDESLITLCENHHRWIETLLESVKKHIIDRNVASAFEDILFLSEKGHAGKVWWILNACTHFDGALEALNAIADAFNTVDFSARIRTITEMEQDAIELSSVPAAINPP
jgi:5-methylcytosine-specific restriction endonuclease McrA